MKKILIPAAIIILLQGCYILKLRHDLDIRKKINEETILQVFNKSFEYVKHEETPDELPEPSNYTDNPNIVERIDMLEMHIDYHPSKKWIKDVLNQAKNKLK
jgi:hypothetical protein